MTLSPATGGVSFRHPFVRTMTAMPHQHLHDRPPGPYQELILLADWELFDSGVIVFVVARPPSPYSSGQKDGDIISISLPFILFLAC